MVLLDTFKTTIIESLLDVKSPVNLRGVKHNLTGVNDDPLSSWPLQVINNTELDDLSDRENHLALDITHPELDVTVLRVDLSDELNVLAFAGDHVSHSVIKLESKISNSFEDFSQVSTHFSDFLGLRKNFEQLIVGQEVESSEIRTLLFQVVSKTLLDNVQVLVRLEEGVTQAFS